ncbi:MAG TPA: hypothetical protein VEA41_01845 [Salinarimonas sp.]|nr:hypothetical protein [Salinarimonas sp.]
MRDPLSFTWTVKPGNSESVVVLDSTYGLRGSSASLASGSAFLTPGPLRNRWAGAIIRYTVLCTTQNVTGKEQVLTGQAGTSADWEDQGTAGSYTVTAATTSTREFKPYSGDFRLKFDAGGTGPGALTVKVTVIWSDDYGN